MAVPNQEEYRKKWAKKFLKKRLAVSSLKIVASDDYGVYTYIRRNVILSKLRSGNIASINKNTVYVYQAHYFRTVQAVFDDVNRFCPDTQYELKLC